MSHLSSVIKNTFFDHGLEPASSSVVIKEEVTLEEPENELLLEEVFYLQVLF